MELRTLLDLVAMDLNDYEAGHTYQSWTPEQIQSWVNEGVSLVYEKRPDLFMEYKVVKITPCSTLQRVCECDTIRRVIGQVDVTGKGLRPLMYRGLELGFKWRGKSCVPTTRGDKFLLESYALDAVSEALYVYPEVPAHIEVYILVECTVRPDVLDLASDLRPEYTTAVTQWALWRAKSMDMELSPAALTAAQLHYKAFFDILALSGSMQADIAKREPT